MHILTQTVQVPNLSDAAKILTKILTLWVERNNVADDRHKRTANSGEATGGLGGLNPPIVLRGHSRDLRRTDEKILGYPPHRNVVPANTLVLMAHLVTFLQSQ